MTHTPPPWSIGRPHPYTHATPIRWDKENVAWACGLDSAHEFSPAQTFSNARLIAAAPELLAALQGMIKQAAKDAEGYAKDGNEPIWAWIADASDAIAKATA